MDRLERAIGKSVKAAHARYVRLADDWLFYAPESYLQHSIALSIGKATGRWALAEISPAKISREFEVGRLTEKSPMDRRRFDLVVWQKTGDKVAVAEVKRAFRFDPVGKDAQKIEEYAK